MKSFYCDSTNFAVPKFNGSVKVKCESFGRRLDGKRGLQGSYTDVFSWVELAERHVSTFQESKDYPTNYVKYTIIE